MHLDPTLFYFGLLLGASLGGNVTPIGASANIAACGLLKKEGHPVRFGEFVKIGLPFTLAAVLAAYVMVWLVWRP
jgi:Na+/H+ antiporter NhaD/arsenite permease-like protein